MCILCFTVSWCDFFSLHLYHFFLNQTSVSIIYSLYSILLPLCQFSPCGSPLHPLSTLIFYSLFLQLTLLSFCLHSRFSSPSFSPFIISRLSSLIVSLIPLFPPCSSPLPLFSVSVEPLWLHRYSDCWLCRGGGMLFRHSTWRYCTTCTLNHSIKTAAPKHPSVLDHTVLRLYLVHKVLKSIESWCTPRVHSDRIL